MLLTSLSIVDIDRKMTRMNIVGCLDAPLTGTFGLFISRCSVEVLFSVSCVGYYWQDHSPRTFDKKCHHRNHPK